MFVPHIPHGSKTYQGDFKVSVIGLDGLDAELRKKQKDAWPLDRWIAFAEHLGLKPVTTMAAAYDPTLYEAEELLQQYVTEFRRANVYPEQFVPFTCSSDGRNISSEEVIRQIAEERADILVQGPSGCGKTLMATQAGLAFIECGGIAITVPARDYSGSFKAALDREVGLLVSSGATKILKAARDLTRPLLFIVDGYNECTDSERASLTRGLAALARIYEGSVLVTSQILLARGDLLILRAVDVPPAEMETKTAIALNAMGVDVLPSKLEDLLTAITTGLEARLIGEVGRQLNPDSSRYALFDAFARKRLDYAESEGIRLLSHIAGRLSDRVTFSMSVRDLDRLTDEVDLSSTISTRLLNTGLLIRRGDRIHFTHEMFFNAFASEDVIRRAAGQPAAVHRALSSPRHSGRQELILGAIDDDLLLDQVLDGLVDSESVACCLSGACGRRAQEWAEARCTVLWERLRSEALAASSHISSQSWNDVAFDEAKLTTWTALDRAFLDAMPHRIVMGHYLDETLETIGILDRRIADERDRLREEARKHKVALRSALFANAYVFRHSATLGITHICAQLHGGYYRTISDEVRRTVKRTLSKNHLSTGQMYLLLMLTRGANISAQLIVHIIESHWANAPYHLRLCLMEAAHMCRQCDDEDRKTLIATIEALPPPGHLFISTAIVEALQILGALEDSEREHTPVVKEQIRQCLTDQESDNLCAMAYSLYSAQFDHPYSGAHYEVISELEEDDRKTLLKMAVNGVPDTAAFLVPLLIDLASFSDPEIGDSVARWATLPPTDSVMPQDAIAVFVVAHIALARFRCPLPDRLRPGDGPAAEALAACGELLYWCNFIDLDESSRRKACNAPLKVLLHNSSAALDVLWYCEDVRGWGLDQLPGMDLAKRSIVNSFPSESVEMCRHALTGATNQVGYFRGYSKFDRQRNLTFAINLIGQHGNSTDLRLLREYSNDAELGTSAIQAVKTLEERLASA